MTTTGNKQGHSGDIWFNDYPLDPRRPISESIAIIERYAQLDKRTASNLKQALGRVDLAMLDDFVRRHSNRFDNLDPVAQYKYADIAIWAYRMVLVAQHLGLDRSRPRNILDIGSGSGAFGLVAQAMGHRVVGTDVANPWYDELCVLQGAARIEAPVLRGEPYRVEGGPFDLITIMRPAFHRRSLRGGGREYWSVADWAEFLADISVGLLEDDGQIVIVMPLDKNSDGTLSPSPLLEWSERKGAHLGSAFAQGQNNQIRFDAADARNLRG